MATLGNGTPSEPELVIWFNPRIELEGDLYTALFDEFELSGIGVTPDDAIENLKAHIQSHCAALDAKGVLEKVLKAKGIGYDERKGEVPVVV